MITSTKNQRIVNARKLTLRKHRLRQDRFLVEGLQLLIMAVEQARLTPLELFYCESLFTGETAPRLLKALNNTRTDCLPVTEAVLNSLSERDTSQGLVATFAMSDVETSLDGMVSHLRQAEGERVSTSSSDETGLWLILDRLQDPGNLGTLIRTADAVGASGVILLEPCVDPFDPKTVRGTMGSLFTMPFTRVSTVEQVVGPLHDLGIPLVGADGRRGGLVWESTALRGKAGLVLGNEARGLGEPWHAVLDSYVCLPLRGQAESLNVAVAGGALMYEWVRVNG